MLLFFYRNIINFITEYVLILSYFDLLLNTYDIFINKIDMRINNKIKCFTYVNIEIPIEFLKI